MKKNFFTNFKLMSLLAFFFIGTAMQITGQTVTLNAVLSGKVTSLDSTTNGAATNICSTCDRGYMKFDLTSIPAGATIISANLRLVAIDPSTTSGSTVNKITTTTLDADTATAGYYAGFYAGLDAGNTAWTGTWSFSALPATFTLPLNAIAIADLDTSLGTGQVTFGIIRGSTFVYTFGGYNDTTLANIPQLEITYGFPCAGTPVAGIATAPANVCSGINFDLAISANGVTGTSYQWQSSTNGIAYSNIPSATNSTYTASQADTTYYKCIVKCDSSGFSDTSNVLTVNMSPAIDCHCIPPVTDCSLDDAILNVIFATINNTTACSTNGYSYYATPNPVLVQGQTYADSITVGPGGNEFVGVWIDYNQNGSYDSIEFTALGSGNGVQIVSSINIPINATVGNTKMRVRVRYNTALTGNDACLGYSYGETEDYLVTIAAATGCSGTPTAGIATAPASICSGINFNLSIPPIVLAGITCQWQSSADGVTFANMQGATTSTYSLTQSVASYYQCIVTCTTGGAADTSNILNVGMNTTIDCNCLPPATNCTQSDVITNVILATINNSTACSTDGYSYYATPITVLNQGQTYADSITVGPGGTEYVGVWIDYNHSGTYDSTEFTALGSGNGVQIVSSITIPLTSIMGNTKMRIRVRYNTALTGNDACIGYTYGETEDYLVDIAAPLAINETELKGVSVFPNPTTGMFNVSIASANSSQLNIIIDDMQGRTVYNYADKNISNNYTKQIDLKGLSKGVYFLKLNIGSQMKVQKIIVQ